MCYRFIYTSTGLYDLTTPFVGFLSREELCIRSWFMSASLYMHHPGTCQICSQFTPLPEVSGPAQPLYCLMNQGPERDRRVLLCCCWSLLVKLTSRWPESHSYTWDFQEKHKILFVQSVNVQYFNEYIYVYKLYISNVKCIEKSIS